MFPDDVGHLLGIEGFVNVLGDGLESIRAFDVIGMEGGGQHDDEGTGLVGEGAFLVGFQEFEAIHHGHVDVEKDEVWKLVLAPVAGLQIVEGFFAILPDDDLIGNFELFEQEFVVEVDGVVVFNQQDCLQFLHVSLGWGMESENRVPLPGSLCTSMEPPLLSTIRFTIYNPNPDPPD